jgi:type II secretory ATPase GspE/PulE/Tfp pilus assembly ATPase PilB-like protein
MNDEQLAELLQDYQIPLADEHPDRDVQRLKARWVKEFGAKGGLLHRHAPGCEKCGGTGYKGRVGIHEMLVTSPGIRHLVQTKARSEEVQALAIAQGMRTLRQDGIEKVLMGMTTLTEIRATSNF